MDSEILKMINVQRLVIKSSFLGREVQTDLYVPVFHKAENNLTLLLINDGQDLEKMSFDQLLDGLMAAQHIVPMICVGIHANADRRMEYGTANKLDFMQRGAKSALYNRFILEELLPLIQEKLGVTCFDSISYAGFSLGGLSAIDTVWNHPDIFSIAGVFSGSLWWRSKDLHEGYDEEKDRIMHQQVHEGKYNSGLRFYFTTGSQDETIDRNNNGIIDSIDDTLGLIAALKKKGYTDKEINYINYEDGRHDVETWGRAFPDFLKWGWGIVSPKEMQSPESC